MQNADLFYTTECNTLVVIPKIYLFGTGKIDEVERNLSFYRQQIIEEFGVSSSDISVHYVEQSLRYKRCHVFFVNNVNKNTLPSEVYVRDCNRWDILE